MYMLPADTLFAKMNFEYRAPRHTLLPSLVERFKKLKGFEGVTVRAVDLRIRREIWALETPSLILDVQRACPSRLVPLAHQHNYPASASRSLGRTSDLEIAQTKMPTFHEEANTNPSPKQTEEEQ